MNVKVRAKLFISCGQASGAEKAIAADIRQRMERLGFDPYVAVEVHTLKGLREEIFSKLEDMDYFIFIDFGREKLLPHDSWSKLIRPWIWERRGSLFSHQELAIASFLEIDALPFHEVGVKPLDGMMSVFQANSICFGSRQELPRLVEERVRERIREGLWSASHRRRLRLSPGEPIRGVCRTEEGLADFFPIAVENLHHRRSAANTFAFIEKIVDAQASECLFSTPVEIKWGGTVLPSVMISPGGVRLVDGIFVSHRDPRNAFFNAIWTDFSELIPRIPRAGEFHLTYCINSTSFPPARATFRAIIGKSLDDVSLRLTDHG